MSKILLVEDNEMNQDMLSRRLKRQGYDISVASNGQEAIEMVESLHPDLILMDLSLPEIDGWETTRQLKQGNSTKNIPIIVLTAHALESDRKVAFEVGCDDFDVKPIDFPRLLEKIEVQLTKVNVV